VSRMIYRGQNVGRASCKDPKIDKAGKAITLARLEHRLASTPKEKTA
jgi:hypothetical protein